MLKFNTKKVFAVALSLGVLLSNTGFVSHASEGEPVFPSVEQTIDDNNTIEEQNESKGLDPAPDKVEKNPETTDDGLIGPKRVDNDYDPSKEDETDKDTEDKENDKKTKEKDEEKNKDILELEDNETSTTTNSTSNSSRRSVTFDFTPIPLGESIRTDNFRFQKVSKIYAISKKDKVKIYDSIDSKDQKEIGELKKGGVAFILSKINDNYFYVESGNVRGFVKIKDLLFKGEDFDKAIEELKKEYKTENLDEKELNKHYAKVILNPINNKAFAYLRITTKNTQIERRYFISKGKIDIKEDKVENSKTIGTLNKSSYGYVIDEIGNSKWIYIESGNARGFVKKEDISYDDITQTYIKKNGLKQYQKGVAKDTDNKALNYSFKSTEEPIKTTNGQELVDYAQQFIGNPYVWGGTDPVNGADCSGFVGTIYRKFGYSLPRVAENQAYAGRKIPVSEAKPGDLLFYMDSSGYIYHVSMYAGNGRTVEASNPTNGIINGYVSNNVVWATRILEEKEFLKEKDLNKALKIAQPSIIETKDATLSTLSENTKTNVNNLKFDENGFGSKDDRYAVIADKSFANPGEKIDVYLENGTVIPSIVISNNNSNKITFLGDSSVWDKYENKTILETQNNWNSNVEKILKLN